MRHRPKRRGTRASGAARASDFETEGRGGETKRTFGSLGSPSHGPQNRELFVANWIGDRRFDRSNPRSRRPLRTPREKGVDCRWVAFDVDLNRAVRLVA